MFPEMTVLENGVHFVSIPRHPTELLRLLPELRGKTFVTVSEHLILMFLQEVRNQHIDPHELAIYCVDQMDFEHNHLPGHRIRVDFKGDLVDDWPGGFFRERGGLLR